MKTPFMKTIYISLFAILFICKISSAQYYQQYFDGADTGLNAIQIELDPDSTNVWQIGKPQKIIFDSSSTHPFVIVTDTINYYPSNNTSRFTAKIAPNFGSWGWGIFALQWKQKLDLDSTLDGALIEYSIDSGATWVNVFNNPLVYNFYGYDTLNVDTLAGGQYVFNGTDTSWKNIWLCFSNSWLQQLQVDDTLLFRFSLVSDSINTNKEGWMIDNMLAHITFFHTIKEVEHNDYLTIYPNPSKNIINIEMERLQQYHIIEHMELINATGIIVQQWNQIPTKFWFYTSQFPNGTYFLKVKTNVKSVIQKVIINNY
jgi:hypothetical protein